MAVYVLLVLPSGVNLEFMPKPVAQLDTAKKMVGTKMKTFMDF